MKKVLIELYLKIKNYFVMKLGKILNVSFITNVDETELATFLKVVELIKRNEFTTYVARNGRSEYTRITDTRTGEVFRLKNEEFKKINKLCFNQKYTTV